MARYTGPKVKNMRALETYLPGLTGKSMEHRATRPGQHGQRLSSPRKSDYAVQLREKQKLQFNYGLREKHLARLVKEARRSQTTTGDKLIELVERRLDNVVFRSGFAKSLPAARQLVGHGHVQVNGKSVDIASYRVVVGDVISPKEKSRELTHIKDAITSIRLTRPDWLECNYAQMTATVIGTPGPDSVSVEVDVARIVEYYAKRG